MVVKGNERNKKKTRVVTVVGSRIPARNNSTGYVQGVNIKISKNRITKRPKIDTFGFFVYIFSCRVFVGRLKTGLG